MFSALMFFFGAPSADHEPWHREGVLHQREGLPIVPLRIVEKRVVILREGCEGRGDCDLKEIVFFEEHDEFPVIPRIEDDFLGRRTIFMAGIETENVAALKNYVFVQFIRGCMWRSWKEPDGSIATDFLISRTHIGRRTHFVSNDWVVDSVDDDPVSTSDGTGDRHFFLQWSEKRPKWIPRGQQKLFGDEIPTIPFGFVTDSPEPVATFLPKKLAERALPGVLESATNMSLEFRTCVYRMGDVPAKIDGMRGFGVPIACHDWRASHVYDHHRGEFTSPAGVNGQCGKPLSDYERRNEERKFFR